MWRWKVTAEIASYLKNGCVLGLDSSREMIELAKKKFPYKDYSNLTFQIRDVRELEYNEKFDLVFSNAALHWIKNHIIVLKTIQRSLKLGGRVLIQMGGQGNARDVIKVVDEIIEARLAARARAGGAIPVVENVVAKIIVRSGPDLAADTRQPALLMGV